MDVKPKKHLGQHFLVDKSVVQKTKELLIAMQPKNVIEVGPGKGVLTQEIFNIPNKFMAAEIDKESVLYLENHFPDIKIINQDFLSLKLPQIIDIPFLICGNFPYNISSQIVFKMLENREYCEGMLGMFQLEVAQRLCAVEGKKDFGVLSVLTQAFYSVKLEFKIKPGAFFPPPKVQSAVISAKKRKDGFFIKDENLFFKIVKTAFGQRRKMLSNSLKSYLNQGNMNDKLAQFCKLRPEQLKVQDFITLTNILS